MTDANDKLTAQFERFDEALTGLEARLQADEALALETALPAAMSIVHGMLSAYATHAGKPMPETDDLLEIFKAFVKGDPSLNAVRDNVRELVYYRNCLDMERPDALPKAPERMAVRTARHIYLYLHSRAEQERRLEA